MGVSQRVTIVDDTQGVGCAPRSACRWNRPADSLPCLLYRGTMVFLCRPAPVERTGLSVPCLRYVPRAVPLPFRRQRWRHRHRCCVRHSLPAGWTTCWPPFSPPEGGAAMLISSSPPRSSCSLAHRLTSPASSSRWPAPPLLALCASGASAHSPARCPCVPSSRCCPALPVTAKATSCLNASCGATWAARACSHAWVRAVRSLPASLPVHRINR